MKKAIVALARRLAVIMHRMWVDGTEFRWTSFQARRGEVRKLADGGGVKIRVGTKSQNSKSINWSAP